MRVYNDTYYYKSGIYKKANNSIKRGSHAIKILGWGKDQ